MLDVIVIALGLGFFALSAGLQRSPATGSEERRHDLRLRARRRS